MPVRHRRRRGPHRVPHDAARSHAHRAACAEPAGPQRAKMPIDPAVTREGSRIVDRISGRVFDEDGRPDSRARDGSRYDDGRRPPDQPRDRRARGRCVVRESAAFRRLRRDVADSLRHRAPRQAAQADAGRLSHPRDRGVSDRSADDLRGRRRGQFHDARHLLSPERVHRLDRTPTARSPRSKWRKENARRPA